jgi:hypothetical protein
MTKTKEPTEIEITDELIRLVSQITGRQGGLARVPKGFAIKGNASEAGKKGAAKRWGKKPVKKRKA